MGGAVGRGAVASRISVVVDETEFLTGITTATIRIAGVYLIFAGFSSDQLDRLVDVAAWLGIGARLVRSVHEGLSDSSLQARQADVEAGEGESAVSQAKVHFSVDGRGGV